jgi:sporulation protein YlmC with PRC-barrel domain
MKKSSLLKQAMLATMVSAMAVAWLTAQDQPNDTPRSTSPNQDRTTTTGTKSTAEVKKINKCSELIGMEVKNAQGEKLGEIQDVVIDLTGDKVGYVVLATDKGPLSAEKLHAVPLRAFQASADGMSVTLNADKQKLASAEGFTKDNWPNPSNPSWGAEPFWKEPGNNNQPNRYTPGTTPGSTPGTTPGRPGSTPGTTPDRTPR